MRLARLLAFSVVILAARPALAADQVSGTFTVGGKTASLRYVYTFWKAGSGDPSRISFFALFSDVAIPDEAIPRNDRGNQKMAELVREGKVHAFELRFSVPDRKLELEEMAAYHGAISPGRQAQTGMNVLETTIFNDHVIEGKAHSSPDYAEFKYGAQFKVAIPPKPAQR